MSRQRASAAFARVGTARIEDPPADQNVSDIASVSASGNDGDIASVPAARPAVVPASERVSSAASGKDRRNAGKPQRRVGRPRGPERVPLTTRILASENARLTAAVEMTGESPQYIVDAALKAYLDALGVSAS